MLARTETEYSAVVRLDVWEKTTLYLEKLDADPIEKVAVVRRVSSQHI